LEDYAGKQDAEGELQIESINDSVEKLDLLLND